MTGPLFLFIGILSALMGVVGYHWQRESVALAQDSTATWKERADAAFEAQSLRRQMLVMTVIATVGITLGCLVLIGYIPTVSS